MKATETKSVVLLHHHLKALRLPTVGAECEKVAQPPPPTMPTTSPTCCSSASSSCSTREKRAAERRLKAARFPTIKTLETFDFAAPPFGQQGAHCRAHALRVHRQEGEHPAGRQPRDRASPIWPPPSPPRRVPRATGSASSAPPSW